MDCLAHIPAPERALVLSDVRLTGPGELVNDGPVNLLQVWKARLIIGDVHGDGFNQVIWKHMRGCGHIGVVLYDVSEAHTKHLGEIQSGDVDHPVWIADVGSGLGVILLTKHCLETKDAVF